MVKWGHFAQSTTENGLLLTQLPPAAAVAFNDTATTSHYTLALHGALPISNFIGIAQTDDGQMGPLCTYYGQKMAAAHTTPACSSRGRRRLEFTLPALNGTQGAHMHTKFHRNSAD